MTLILLCHTGHGQGSPDSLHVKFGKKAIIQVMKGFTFRTDVAMEAIQSKWNVKRGHDPVSWPVSLMS